MTRVGLAEATGTTVLRTVPSMPVFRVTCSGPNASTPEAQDALDAVGARWEGGDRVLVGAETSYDAIATVRDALSAECEFGDFQANPVLTRSRTESTNGSALSSSCLRGPDTLAQTVASRRCRLIRPRELRGPL